MADQSSALLSRHLGSHCSDRIMMNFVRPTNVRDIMDIGLQDCADDNQFTDVTFISSDNHTFRMHRLMLSSVSPLLASLLNTSLAPVLQPTILLPDFDSSTISSLYQLLYGTSVFATAADISELNYLLKALSINVNISAVNSIDISAFQSRPSTPAQDAMIYSLPAAFQTNQLISLPAGPEQLTSLPAGPGQLINLPAGPDQLTSMSAGPNQLQPDKTMLGQIQIIRSRKRGRKKSVAQTKTRQQQPEQLENEREESSLTRIKRVRVLAPRPTPDQTHCDTSKALAANNSCDSAAWSEEAAAAAGSQPVSEETVKTSQLSADLPYVCWQCNTEYETFPQLTQHVETHSSSSLNTGRPSRHHRCPRCKKVLPSMWKLRQHLTQHHATRKVSGGVEDHQYAGKSRRTRYRKIGDHGYVKLNQLEDNTSEAGKEAADNDSREAVEEVTGGARDAFVETSQKEDAEMENDTCNTEGVEDKSEEGTEVSNEALCNDNPGSDAPEEDNVNPSENSVGAFQVDHTAEAEKNPGDLEKIVRPSNSVTTVKPALPATRAPGARPRRASPGKKYNTAQTSCSSGIARQEAVAPREGRQEAVAPREGRQGRQVQRTRAAVSNEHSYGTKRDSSPETDVDGGGEEEEEDEKLDHPYSSISAKDPLRMDKKDAAKPQQQLQQRAGPQGHQVTVQDLCTVGQKLRSYENSVAELTIVEVDCSNTAVVRLKKDRPKYSVNGFSCDQCNKSFPVPYRLNRHIREVHMKEKDHKCQDCGKQFFKSSSLLRHMVAVHSTLRPFPCTFCGTGFKDSSALGYHVKKGVCRRKHGKPE